jgi:hypothetical protein
MKYDLSALEIIKILGYNHPVGQKWLEKIKLKNQVNLPVTYCNFMEFAVDCPLFHTSDLWVGKMVPTVYKPWMFYELIQETIDDRKGLWKSPLSKYESLLYELSQLPREQWPEKLDDYLLIGSDYIGGIGYFGIRKEDLHQDDPPVYWHLDGYDFTSWKLEDEKLSRFLLRVLYDSLSCNDYDTAEGALEKMGWRYEEYFDIEKEDWAASKAVLKKQGIAFSKLKKYNSNNGIKIYCCYDEEKNIFYTGIIDEGEILLSAINRTEAERIFIDFENLEDSFL